MRCTTAQHEMHRHLDGELPADRHERLEAHLSACSTCRERWEHLTAIRATIQRLAEVTEVPITGDVPLVFATHQTAWRRRAMAVAAMVAIGVGTILAIRSLHKEPSAPVQFVRSNPQPSIPKIAPPAAPADQQPVVRVQFPADDVIAQPIQTSNPNITIIWVYPIVKTARANDATQQPSS